MKKTINLLSVIALSILISFSSCKKTDKITDTSNTELAEHSEDQARVASEIDAIADDAANAVREFPQYEGRPSGTNDVQICSATTSIDSTSTLRRITIVYNGLNCQQTRSRVGTVVLTMPINSRFADQNAVLTVDIQNLKITRLVDSNSITINGIKTITNVTGGRLRDLPNLGSVEHEIASSGMSITFNNGTQRVWQIAKKRRFELNNGLVITTTGTHTDGNVTGISEWGTNRAGNAFTTSITKPMVIREDCNFRLVSGEVTHHRLIADVVATFGLDSAGNPTSCPGTGRFYYKIVWTGVNGVVRTVIAPY